MTMILKGKKLRLGKYLMVNWNRFEILNVQPLIGYSPKRWKVEVRKLKKTPKF